MKKNCGIIKDLIPMYVENLTSEDSNQLIKEHLHTCEACTNFLRNVDSDLPNDALLDIDVDKDDRKLMKGIKHRINSMMFIAILIGILIGVGLSLKFFSFALVGLVSFLLFIGFLIYFVNKNVETKNEKRGGMMVWLNVGSLVLGLIAWILPVVNLMLYKKRDHRNWGVLSIMSISACAVSLYFQVVYGNYLVEIEDWSALMDTRSAVVFVGAVLLIVTLLLNIITLIVYRHRTVE
jgi:hypothetical protein